MKPFWYANGTIDAIQELDEFGQKKAGAFPCRLSKSLMLSPLS
jgi:hypothetical protein